VGIPEELLVGILLLSFADEESELLEFLVEASLLQLINVNAKVIAVVISNFIIFFFGSFQSYYCMRREIMT
jgi:hypothetical protein